MGPPELFTPDNFETFFHAELNKGNVDVQAMPSSMSRSFPSPAAASSSGPQKKKFRVMTGASGTSISTPASWTVFDSSLFRSVDGDEGDGFASSSSSSSSLSAAGRLKSCISSICVSRLSCGDVLTVLPRISPKLSLILIADIIEIAAVSAGCDC